MPPLKHGFGMHEIVFEGDDVATASFVNSNLICIHMTGLKFKTYC